MYYVHTTLCIMSLTTYIRVLVLVLVFVVYNSINFKYTTTMDSIIIIGIIISSSVRLQTTDLRHIFAHYFGVIFNRCSIYIRCISASAVLPYRLGIIWLAVKAI